MTMSTRFHARGGALLVAMIMIFMMSVMGVSVMRGSTLERRMATNAIQAREVSQEAESVTEALLNDKDNLTAAFVAGADDTDDIEVHSVSGTVDSAGGLETLGTLEFVGSGPAPGFSVGTFEALRFIAQGSAQIPSVGAASTIEQGAYQPVPATN